MARPKHMRRGKYRMTPARRAALKKAQAVAAKRKRRKHIAKRVGKGAANLGGMFIAARVSSYVIKPSKVGKDYNTVKNFFKQRGQKSVIEVPHG